MDRLISEKQVLDVINEAIRMGRFYCGKERTIEEIKAIPSAEPKWIPVSEKLPEFRKEVLTCSNGGFIEIQSLEDNYDGYWENQKGDWTDLEEIIAWMPLPKPYEPQEKRCEDCNHYGKFSLDCGRCDDDCSMYEPKERSE